MSNQRRLTVVMVTRERQRPGRAPATMGGHRSEEVVE